MYTINLPVVKLFCYDGLLLQVSPVRLCWGLALCHKRSFWKWFIDWIETGGSVACWFSFLFLVTTWLSRQQSHDKCCNAWSRLCQVMCSYIAGVFCTSDLCDMHEWKYKMNCEFLLCCSHWVSIPVLSIADCLAVLPTIRGLWRSQSFCCISLSHPAQST